MKLLNECGRSLVETLGMLAIMGILSVIGMWGYNSAMDKSKANTLIQEAQKRAVIVAGQIGFNNQTPSLAEFSPYDNGMFDSSRVYYKEDGLTGQFGIKILNVEKSVCQNILNTIGEKTPIRRLSKETSLIIPITVCDNVGTYVIIYNNDMTENDSVDSPRTCQTVNDCKTSCAICNIEEGQETGTCTEECDEPAKMCESDTDCNQKNECRICNTTTNMCEDGCKQVAYLQSSGNQWIDTGFKPNNNTSVLYNCSVIGNISNRDSHLFGSRLSASSQAFDLAYMNRKETAFETVRFISGTTYYQVQSPLITDTKIKDNNTYYMSGTRVDINGTNVLNFTTASYQGTYSLWLFGVNNAGTLHDQVVAQKVYSCKIWDNGSLVFDFVPVHASFRSAGQQNCMLNKVADETGKLKLYCSETESDFIIPAQ